MAKNKLPFAKVSSINRPHIFGGINYQFWKVRGIWNAIIN